MRVDFSRRSDFLPQAEFKRQVTADLRGALAATLDHGFMATPSGKSAIPDTVATTVLLAVLITETSLEIRLET